MTTDLHIRVDATEALGLMGRISDNLPRATTWALNRTGEEMYRALRLEAQGRFILRGTKGQRVLNWYAPAKIPAHYRARDNKPYVSFVPERAGDILRPFETGSPKLGTPGRPVAIPTKLARPTPQSIIPQRLFPTSLFPETSNFTIPKTPAKWNKGKGRKGQAYLSAKPFILSPYTGGKALKPSSWGIYQRVGPGRGDIRMLWAFRQVARRPKLLNTYDTARRIVAQQWAPNMVGMFRSLVRSPIGKASLLDLTV